MVETVAEAYDALTEKYLDNGELSVEEIIDGLRVGTMRNTFTAVLCGSAMQNIGVQGVARRRLRLSCRHRWTVPRLSERNPKAA